MPLQICGLQLHLGLECLLAILFFFFPHISHVSFFSKFYFNSSLLNSVPLPITSKRNKSQSYQTRTRSPSYYPSIKLTVTWHFLSSFLLSLGFHLFKANFFTHALNPVPFYRSRDLMLSAVTCWHIFHFFFESFSNNNQIFSVYFTTIKKYIWGEICLVSPIVQKYQYPPLSPYFSLANSLLCL